MNAPRVAVIGLGAIGGSVGLALLARGITPVGFAASADDRSLAAVAGVQIRDSVEDAARDAEIVLVATPLDVLPNVARQVVTTVPSATVLHAGSLLRADAYGGERMLPPAVIGTHPLAGSHLSGFAAAHAEMYRGAVVYVERKGSARQRADAELLWSLAGAARIELVDPTVHDAAMGWVSHTPQLVSKAMAYAMASSPLSEWTAGPGLASMTRLAASDFHVWRPILERAPDSTREALAQVMMALAELREALEAKDWTRMETLWNRASRWRDEQGFGL